MKKMLLLSVLLHPAMRATPIIETIAQQFVEEKDGVKVVKPAVANLLRNDGLFADQDGSIALTDAAQKTKETWFNKEWVHTPSEEDMQKADRIDQGNVILKSLYQEEVKGEQADTIIAHGGVLPSVMKMFLAVEKVAGARRLIVVTEPTDPNIQRTPVENYEKAATMLEGHSFPIVTQEAKPQGGKEVVELVRQGFNVHDLEIKYVTKSGLPEFIKNEVAEPTKVVVASSYPQLESHILAFSAAGKENANWQVVGGVTAGAQEKLEELYDASSKEARYNFDRNNFARILHRLAEYYNNAQ